MTARPTSIPLLSPEPKPASGVRKQLAGLVYTLPLVTVVAACAAGALPLARVGFPATSDGYFHLLRAIEVWRQWQAGIAVPRWAPDFYLGYGYPILLFTPLMPYFLVAAVHSAWLGFPAAMGVVESAGLMVSGVAGFFWLRERAPAWPAALGAVFLALAPYHLVNLYFRGDLSEFLATCWFPLILLNTDRMFAKPGLFRCSLLSLSLAGLILTHFLSVLLFVPAAILLSLPSLQWRSARMLVLQVVLALVAGVAALAVTAWSWLPATLLQSDLTLSKLYRFYNWRDNFADLHQLIALNPIQQYGAVFIGSAQYGYQFGLAQGLVCLVGGVVLVGMLFRRDWRSIRLVVTLLVAGVALALCTSVSTSVWSTLTPLQLVQFPWRYLAIAGVAVAAIAAELAGALPKKVCIPASFAAILLITGSSLWALVPVGTDVPKSLATAEGIATFETLYHLVGTSAAGEYLPASAADRLTVSGWSLQQITGEAPTQDPAATVPAVAPASTQHFALTQTSPSLVVLPILGFPGWNVQVDGQDTAWQPSQGAGLIAFPLGGGQHKVIATFGDVRWQRLATVLSVAGLLAIGLALGWGALTSLKKPKSERTAEGPTDHAQSDYFIATSCVAVAGVLIAAVIGASSGRGESLGSPVPVDVTLLGALRLTSYTFGSQGDGGTGAHVTPGNTLYVQVGVSNGSDKKLVAQLVNPAGTPWASWTGQAEPTTTIALSIPAAAPPGIYLVEVGTARASGEDDWTPVSMRFVPLLPVNGAVKFGPVVIGLPTATAPNSIPIAVWKTGLSLQKSALPTAVRADTNLLIATTWQLASNQHPALQVAYHLVNSDGFDVTSAVSEPADGYYPTRLWHEGQPVDDRFALLVPGDIVPGTYQLRVESLSGGVPQPASRLDETPLGDAVDLGALTVSPPVEPATFAGTSTSIGGLQVQLASAAQALQAGTSSTFELRWHAPSVAPRVPTLTFVITEGGVVIGSTVLHPGGAGFAVDRWRAGETVREYVKVAVSPAAIAGSAQMIVRDDDQPAKLATVGSIQVNSRQHTFTASPQVPASVGYSNGVQLIGYNLHADGQTAQAPEISARQSIDLTLFWQASGVTNAPLKVSVQVIDAGGKLATQSDLLAGGDGAPSTSWVAGEIITSEHHLALAQLPAGAYTLYIILYDSASGKRVASGSGDALKLLSVVVP